MIGFGTKHETTRNVIQEALNLGYCLVDAKDSNASLKHFKHVVFDRKKVLLCSKLMAENHHPQLVEVSCRKSLQKAGLDYWDIYYIHTCHSTFVSLLDTYRAILKLLSSGHIRKIGLSNVTKDQLDAILCNDLPLPDYVQIEIHPYLVEESMVQFCNQHAIQIVAHSPFGASLRQELFQENLLKDLATKYQKTPAQVILRWHVQRSIIPIPSSTNVEHFTTNLSVNGFFLAPEEMLTITSLDRGKRVQVKPHHFESIWERCAPLSWEFCPDPKGVSPLQIKGFHIGTTCPAVHAICEKIRASLLSGKKLDVHRHFRRAYEAEHDDPLIKQLVDSLLRHPFFDNMAVQHMGYQNFLVRGFVKTSIPTLNLRPTAAALYHRDLQVKSLKVIIYLCDVDESNGAVRIVERGNARLKWFMEPSSGNPRTTEEEIRKHCGEVITVKGPTHTMLVFDGSLLHSGGYVLKGYRHSVYLEFVEKNRSPTGS